jgi:hypothetical protein
MVGELNHLRLSSRWLADSNGVEKQPTKPTSPAKLYSLSHLQLQLLGGRGQGLVTCRHVCSQVVGPAEPSNPPGGQRLMGGNHLLPPCCPQCVGVSIHHNCQAGTSSEHGPEGPCRPSTAQHSTPQRSHLSMQDKPSTIWSCCHGGRRQAYCFGVPSDRAYTFIHLQIRMRQLKPGLQP